MPEGDQAAETREQNFTNLLSGAKQEMGGKDDEERHKKKKKTIVQNT